MYRSGLNDVRATQVWWLVSYLSFTLFMVCTVYIWNFFKSTIVVASHTSHPYFHHPTNEHNQGNSRIQNYISLSRVFPVNESPSVPSSAISLSHSNDKQDLGLLHLVDVVTLFHATREDAKRVTMVANKQTSSTSISSFSHPKPIIAFARSPAAYLDLNGCGTRLRSISRAEPLFYTAFSIMH